MELAVGHVSIVADTSKLPGQIKKSLGGASGYGSDVGSSIGSKISSGIGKTLKAGVAGVGIAAGGALAGSITKGLGRLTGIETAQAKLKGLGNDAKDVDQIMDNALASVKGTSFGLGEAATTAAGAVAAGIKPGEELEDVLKSVANSAAATSSDMDEMGGIFNKVASIGKAQNDVLMQVADRGLPIYEALADQLGVTADEVFKMASAGEIGFAEFESAMTQAAGTVAEELGLTTVGTLENVSSAMGRFGEALLAPAFSAAPSLFGGIITVFDEMSDAVKPVSEELGNTLTPALENFAGIIETRVAPMAGEAVGKIGDIVLAITDKALNPDTWEKFGDIFTTIKDTVADLWPSIESLAGSFLTVTQNVSVATWQILASALDAIAPLIESVLVPLVEKVAEFAENNPGVVEKMVMAFLGFKAVGAISGPIGSAASTLGTLGSAVKGVSGAFKGASIGQGLLNLMGGAKSANPILAKLGGAIGKVFGVLWKAMPALSKVGKMLGKGLKVLGPWGIAISVITSALTYFFTQTELGQKVWQGLVDAVTGALDWIKEKFGEFTGWISDAWNGLKALFLEGDFTSALRDAFGWEEDNAFVGGILTARDAFIGLRDLIVGGDFGEKLRNVFGWEEDHPMVAGILTVREVAINTFNTIKENVGLAVDAIKNTFGAVWSLLTGDIEGFKDSARAALDGVADIFSNAWSTIKENASLVFSTIWDSLGINPEGALGRTLSGVWDIFANAFETVKQNLADWASAGNDVLKGIFAFTTGDFDGFKEHFGNAFESIKDIASRTWETIKENASTLWEAVQFAAPRAWDGIKEQASSAWDSISSTVSTKADEMWSGIKSGAKSAFDWASDNEITGPAVGVIASIGEGIGNQWTEFDKKVQPMKDAVSDLWGVLTGNGEDNTGDEKRGGIAGFIDSFTGQVSDLQEKFEPAKSAISDLWGVLTGESEEFTSSGEGGIAGLIDTFTENVSGLKEKMQPGIDAIKDVWNALTGRDDSGKPVGEGEEQGGIAGMVQTITDKLTELRTNVQPVLDEFKDKWNELKDAVQPHLEKVSEVLGDVAKKIGGATLVIAVGLLLSPFIILAGAIYGAVVALNGIADAFAWVSEKWTLMKTNLEIGWAKIKEFVIDAFERAWENLKSNFQKVMDALNGAWTGLKDALNNTWLWIDENVIGGFRRGMDRFKSFFEGIVDGIKSVWNTLRSALAKPINFMINTVYNGGILKAWETIRKFLPGLKEASPLAGIPEHATGGRISGPGTGTSDDVLMWGSNGEHMLTAREVQRFGGHGHVYAMRKMLNFGRPFSFDGRGGLTPLPRSADNRAGDLYGAAPGLLPAYKDGGEIRPLWEHQLMAAHKFAQSQSGKPYQWAGPTGPGSSFDCSGFMGSIAATIQGTNPWQRYWATMSFPSPGAQGFAPGLGPGFSIGIFNGGPYGGHTAGTLGPAGPYGSVNVESGGAPSMVKYGPGAVGADHSQFTMRYHLPIGADGAFVSGGGGGISPEAMQDGLKKKVSDFVDKAMNPILSKLPVGPPEWQNIPKGVYDKGKKGMLDTAFDVVGKLGDKLASVWTAAGEVKDLVTGAVSGAASWVNDRVRSIVVRDNGGIVPNGAAAINTSGRDELMLPPSATQAFLRSVPIWHELVGAWKGIDFGYAATSEVVGDRNAIKLLDEVSWIGAAVGEMKLAQKGQDGGYSAMERYFGKTRAIEILNGIESASAVMGELRLAFEGSDGGYAELSRYMGDNIAKSIVDGTAVIGNLWRNGIGTWRLDPELEEQARKSAEDYAAEQASGLLSTFGLEGLVPLAQKAGAEAWQAYQASPYDVGVSGQTIVVEYVGDENDREWKMLQKLDKEVALLKAKRKPKASAMTRGGVQ